MVRIFSIDSYNSHQTGLAFVKKMFQKNHKKIYKSEWLIIKSKTLLLDLDQTLIHSFSQRENPQVTVTAFGGYGEESKSISVLDKFVHDFYKNEPIICDICFLLQITWNQKRQLILSNFIQRKLNGNKNYLAQKTQELLETINCYKIWLLLIILLILSDKNRKKYLFQNGLMIKMIKN